MRNGPASTRTVTRAAVRLTGVLIAVLCLLFVGGLAIFVFGGLDALAVGGIPYGIGSGAADAGWSPSAVTAGLLVLEGFNGAVGIAAAVLVLRGADSWFRVYVAAALALFGTMSGLIPLAYGTVLQSPLPGLVQGIAWIAIFQLAYLFPDGRFVVSWTRWLPVAWALFFAGTLAAGAVGVPPNTLPELVILLALLTATIAAGAYRFSRISTPHERGQTAWVLTAFGLRLVLSVVAFLIPVAREDTGAGAWSFLAFMGSMALSYSAAALLPLAVAASVIRHGLFGVDLWVNRGLVYATLASLAFGGYAVIVGAIGAIRPASSGPVPILAAAVVVIVVGAARARVQAAVNRLIYGQRREPHAVVAQLGDRLETAGDTATIAATIVETLADSLRLAYVRLRIDTPVPVSAASGTSEQTGPLVALRLRHDDRDFGVLEAAPRAGDRLSESDVTLLRGLAHQAEGALHAAAVTAELRQAHERLVHSVAAERVRLYRDLHDGLGPSLASIYQQVDAARRLIPSRGATAETLLESAAATTRSVLSDIRRLVFDLAPLDLHEKDLRSAIRDMCDRLVVPPSTLSVSMAVDELPALDPRTELAAFRIASEALTNTVRHAEATNARISVAVEDSRLVVRIVDDGRGIAGDTAPGTGLTSMRARVDELGGTFTVDTDNGTSVCAELPLRRDEVVT